jgi:hypothetical protein
MARTCAVMLERLMGAWIWYRSIGYPSRLASRLSMILKRERAVRKKGVHLVAIVTIPGCRTTASSPTRSG